MSTRSRDSYSIVIYGAVDASNQPGVVQRIPDRAILRGPAHLVQIQGSGSIAYRLPPVRRQKRTVVEPIANRVINCVWCDRYSQSIVGQLCDL